MLQMSFIDLMMDMLGKPEVRDIIAEKYQNSNEQSSIRKAVKKAITRSV